MNEKPKCKLCGEPMPDGEEMFKFHGYSGPCPKPHLPRSSTPRTDAENSYIIHGITHVPIHFARQLERESEAFRQQLNKLEKSVMEFEVTVKSIKPNCRPPQSQEWNRGFAAAQRALIYAYEICFKEQPCRDQ